jgi:hypothetical protein
MSRPVLIDFGAQDRAFGGPVESRRLEALATHRRPRPTLRLLPRRGQQDIDEGAEALEERDTTIRITTLKVRAKELGFELNQESIRAAVAGRRPLI